MIGQTNSQAGGGIRGEKVNILLLTNQPEHSDLLGAVVTVKYADNETQYVWEGAGLTVTIPPYVEYEISVSSIEDYATPEKVTGTAVVDNSRTLTFTYNTTVVTADIQNNQSASLEAKMIINGKELADGESAKFPTGTELSISFSDVEGYKTPDSKTTAASNAAMTVTGTYQAEQVVVNISASDGTDMNGATVNINGTDYIYEGSPVKVLVPFGKEYSIVPAAVGSLATPDTQTFTASQQIREVSLLYRSCVLVVSMLSNQENDAAIAALTASVALPDETIEVANGQAVNVPAGVSVTITFPDVDGYRKPDAISFTHTGGEVEKTGTYETQVLTVNVVGSGATPSGYTVTITDTSSNIVLGTLTSDSGTFKIPYGASYKVSASALTGYNSVTDQTGTASSLSNSITVTYVYNPTKDLSKYDIYGNAISQTTANCYVVSEAGEYKFPLVYGCALKNGSANSAAYTNGGGSYQHDFVTHDGTVITSPYIETMEGTAASAQLTIADTDGIFTDISIIDGSPCRYVQFSVASVPATGANGIISVKNSSGVIMWNWHIWVWPDDLTPVEITNSTSVKYNILPVNLGSKWDDSSKTYIKNWFYQFGRPTPLVCPAAYNSTTSHATYGALGFTTASIASNLYLGIRNPTTFYKYSSSYNYNWFSTNSGKTYNLWDAGCSTTGNSDNDVVKTVYDPCPVGFRMPNGNTFTYFSTSNVVGNFANGWKFKRNSGDTVGVFFPASGFRYYSDGSLNDVGSYGYVWLSSAYSQNYAYYLDFNSSYVDPQNLNNRAYGFSVRPVQE